MSDEWIAYYQDMADRLWPVLDRNMLKDLLQVYEVTRDPERKEDMRRRIEQYVGTYLSQTRSFKHPVLAVPDNIESRGDVRLGRVLWGDQAMHYFWVGFPELNRHMLITAAAGGGKTTLMMHLISQFMMHEIPFLITDFKQDYRHMVKEYKELLVINWKDLRVNPLLPPPGVDYATWKQQVMNIFGYVESVWKGSTNYLLEMMDETHRDVGDAMTFEDVHKTLMKYERDPNPKRREYWGVVQSRVYGLCTKLGETVCSRELMDLPRLLQLPVVLELDGLDKEDADFLVLWVFFWIYAYRKAQYHRGKLRHVLIIDEAKRVFTGSAMYSSSVTEYTGVAPADLICDEIRDFGEAIIAADQEPTKVSQSMKANSYTKVTGNLGNGLDVQDIAGAMNLDDEERGAISTLDRGEWLVKLSGRYTKPFLLKTDDYPIVRDITLEEVRKRMDPRLKELMTRQGTQTVQEEIPFGALSPEAWGLLKNINGNPFLKVRTRAKMLGFSGRKITEAGGELVKLLLVKPVHVAMQKGRPVTLFEITSSGQKLLAEQGEDVKKWDQVGHVGLKHLFYQALIAKAYRNKGYEVKLEAVEGERRFDVLAWNKEERIGIEVEMSWNEMDSKLKNAELVDTLIIVGEDEEMELRVRKAVLQRGVGEKVRVMTILELMRELSPSIGAEDAGTIDSMGNKANGTPETEQTRNEGGEA